MSSPSIVRREVAGELLVLDLATQRIHRLNETATRICRLHEEGRSPEGIADVLTDEFGVDRATALDDVKKTLTSLASLGLFTHGPSDYPDTDQPSDGIAAQRRSPSTGSTEPTKDRYE